MSAPRRSGRATKGQHTKKETPEPAEPETIKKQSSRKVASEVPPSEAEEEDAIIRCVCGINEEDDEGGRMMICCDNCSAWQHNDCMGLSEDANAQPDSYRCEQCGPEDHKELLDAMARGERPWEAAALRRKEAEKQTKRKGGRKSKGGRPAATQGPAETNETSPAPTKQRKSSTPAAQPGSGNKRKLDEEENNNLQHQTKLRGATTKLEPEDDAGVKRRKSSAAIYTQSKASKNSTDNTKLANDISEIPNKARQNVATELKKRFAEQIKEVSKQGLYRVPDSHTPDSLGNKFGLLVEYSLYMNHCGDSPEPTEAYKSQFRAITFNVKKNDTLMKRLLNGTLHADQLATMSSNEMASEELKQQMEQMKEEADKQHILIRDDGPRIRRTHKGEEFVGDDMEQQTSEPVMSAPPLRRRESDMNDVEAAIQSPVQPSYGSPLGLEKSENLSPRDAKPLTIDTSGPPSAGLERKSSSNFDIQNVWSSVQSPGHENKRLLEQPPRRQSSKGQSQQHGPNQTQGDDDIDRLLEDDDNESMPYSPAEYSDPNTIWQGKLTMSHVGGLFAACQHVAGADWGNERPWASVFPLALEITGRIDKARADSYLTSLSASKSTDVTVHQLTVPNSSDQMAIQQFDLLYDYFASRKRYGVISKNPNRDVRDTYIIYIEPGMGPMPEFLDKLAHMTIEQPRPNKMLLVAFVLKYNDQVDGTQATPRPEAPASAMSPIAPSAPPKSAMSPAILGGGLPYQYRPPSNSNSFPGNPYDPPSGPQEYPSSFPTASEASSRAQAILGPLINAPVAQQLLQAAPELETPMLENLKAVLQDNPKARNDFALFQQILNAQS